MSYAIRGNNCNCQTSALTSNAKYIAPFSAVYYDQVTDMWLYPGRTGFTYPYEHSFGPNILKAWKVESDKSKPTRRMVFQSKKDKTIVNTKTTHVRDDFKETKKCPTC